MPKFIIEYGLVGQPLKKSIEQFPLFSDAYDEALIRAIKILEDAEWILETKREIYSQYGRDVFLAHTYYMNEVLPHIEINVKEIKTDQSIMYLVSNQTGVFDSSKFISITIDEAISLLEKEDVLGLDTETEGLDCFTKALLLLQIGNKEFQVNFDISSFQGKIPKLLKDFLNNYHGLFILQNAKFDLKFLFRQDVLLRKVYDTMLVETIITNGLQYSGRDLKTIAEKYCGVTLDKSVRGEIIIKGLTDRVLEYGANDVKYLPEIREKQLEIVAKYNLQRAVDLDNSFVIVLAYTEYCGIKLDYDKWGAKVDKNVETVHKYKTELEDFLYKDGKTKYFSGMYDLFSGVQDCTINWDSPKQVMALMEEYGVNTTIYIKGEEKKSIDAKTLDPQKDQFPIIKPYLKYKEAQKEVTTYGYNWKRYINPITGRIHTTFKQLMDTGRLSCGDKRDGTPNLQNIPRDEETRACFVCEEGSVLIDADYSSQEQIVLANFSKEVNLLNFYKQGFTDMHSYVAFLMYEDIRKCSLEELTPDKLSYIKIEYPENRRIAKSAGFAINYGGNGSTIAKNCNLSKKEGDFVYDSYFEAFPNLRGYFDLVFARASHFGYIEYNNVTRRKYFFNPEENYYFKYRDRINDKLFWYEETNPKEIISKFNEAKGAIARLAQNYPIQGSSADITKYAGILFMKEILSRNWYMIVKIVNFVHDEILVECPKEIAEEVKDILLKCMTEAGNPFCRVLPLSADALVGKHWVH